MSVSVFFFCTYTSDHTSKCRYIILRIVFSILIVGHFMFLKRIQNDVDLLGRATVYSRTEEHLNKG